MLVFNFPSFSHTGGHEKIRSVFAAAVVAAAAATCSFACCPIYDGHARMGVPPDRGFFFLVNLTFGNSHVFRFSLHFVRIHSEIVEKTFRRVPATNHGFAYSPLFVSSPWSRWRNYMGAAARPSRRSFAFRFLRDGEISFAANSRWSRSNWRFWFSSTPSRVHRSETFFVFS